MALLKSTYARRKGTGRKPKKLPIRRRAVHERRHRKFRGIHSQPAGAKERNYARALALVKARQAARIAAGRVTTAAQAAQRSTALRAANKARSLAAARAKTLANASKVKPKSRKVKPKPSTQSGTTISPESYINMF
jgi:hypothetical protein